MSDTPTPEGVLSKVRSEIEDQYGREYYRFHQARYSYLLEKIIEIGLPEGARVLDAGCYPPHLMRALEILGYEVHGISSTHEPVEEDRVVSLNLETDPLPFDDDFFDLVLFSEVMEHLVVSPVIYLKKFRRVLDPGGGLIITTPNAAGIHKLLPIMFGRSTYFPLDQLLDTEADYTNIYHRHNREFTRDELMQVSEMVGFSVQESEFFIAYPPGHEKRYYESFGARIKKQLSYGLARIVPRFRDSLYLRATPSR